MLLRRVLTALALLSMLIPALLAPQAWVWAAFSLIFVLLACGEWMRLLEPSRSQTAMFFALLATGLLIFLDSMSQERLRLSQIAMPVSMLACLAWCLLVPLSFRGLARQSWLQAWLACLFLLAAWLALLELHRIDLLFLFSCLALVWVADIAAYFTGRSLGRRKLAPAISPGKTQEGALGACLGVALIGFVCIVVDAAWLESTLPRRWYLSLTKCVGDIAAAIWVLLVLQVLVLLSILGDLFESQLKRMAGVKDSSNLLPGHGGILDRIDALLPVLPATILIDRWIHWLSLRFSP